MEPNLPFKVITMKNMQMVPSYVECVCHNDITYQLSEFATGLSLPKTISLI